MPEQPIQPNAPRTWKWPATLSAYRGDLTEMLAASVADDGILGYTSPLTKKQEVAFCDSLEREVDCGRALVLIGEDARGVLAMCIVSRTLMPNCRHVAEVSKAYLAPRVRHTGAVTELVLALCQRMRGDGIEQLRIDVREDSPGHRVWEKFGFKTYGILDDYSRINGQRYRGHFMTHSVVELSTIAEERLAVVSRCHQSSVSSTAGRTTAMPLGRDEFRSKLEETLHSHLTISHPIFGLLLDEKNPQPEFLRQVALQGYQLTKHFLEYIENLFFYCPIPRHKRRLLHNMYEEETGRISKTKNHVKLMQDFLRALNIDDETRDAAVALPATQELIQYRMDAVKDPARYHIGAAAVTVASEGQNLETLGSESRDVLFERVYGLTPADLLFFSVHQVEDVLNVQQGLDIVDDLCTTDQMQKEALFGVSHTCELFYQMYEGIYQEYLAGRLLPADSHLAHRFRPSHSGESE